VVADQLTEQQSVFQQTTSKIIQSVCSGAREHSELYEAAVALWCTCTMVYHWDITAPDVNAAFAQIDIRALDHLGRSADFAALCFHAFEAFGAEIQKQAKRIAVRTLIRPKWFLERMQPEIVLFLKTILTAGENALDEVVEIVDWDQRTVHLLRSRIQGE
jgi:hypothetical protein